ncbi:MAG: DUF455 family protein [Planctomycetota bacterium]|nr:DUF455 family protein [Planctomycetota bacterium]
MQVREFAAALLAAPDLEAKLTPPLSLLKDDAPAGGVPPQRPARAPEIAIRTGPEIKVPPLEGMADPAQRVRILHAFANHELQAVELFAWALLNFSEAPEQFRRGLLSTLRDEQRHARLYIHRLEELGGHFGDYPLSGYFWGKLGHYSTPRGFVCAMCLTFENANLDHTLEYAAAATRAGDEKTAKVLYEVHADEIRHVRFGLEWLDAFKEASEERVAAWEATLEWPLRPALARGYRLHEEPRRVAGFDETFLKRLAQADVRDRQEGSQSP